MSLRENAKHFCGGSIINNRWVLTSATCLKGKSAGSLTILIGSEFRAIGGYIFGVLRIRTHEFYEPITFYNDVGLVQSTNYFTFTSTVQPVELISRAVTNVPVILSGWGYTFTGIGYYSDYLNYVEMNLLSFNDCFQRWNINRDSVCTSPNAFKGFCDGDGGSPLVLPGEGQVGIVGFVFSVKCGNEAFPDIYTSVNYHRQWIINNAV